MWEEFKGKNALPGFNLQQQPNNQLNQSINQSIDRSEIQFSISLYQKKVKITNKNK